MTLLVAVTANNLARIGAILLSMALLSTVVTSTTTAASGGTITTKVTNYACE